MNPSFRWEEPATYSDEWLQQAKAYHSSHAYPDYDDEPACLPCWDTRVVEVDARHARKPLVVTVTDWTGPRFFAPCHCLGPDPDLAVVVSLVESVIAEQEVAA